MTLDKPVVVLDTNLFVASFWNTRSASASIMEACGAGQLVPVYTSAIKRELDRVMRNIGATAAYKERVERLFERALLVEPTPAPVATEDRDDQKFLECAVGATADYLITSDEHLLKLKRVETTEILTPSAFWRKYRSEP